MKSYAAFISHTSTEAPVAVCLKDWVETTFAGSIMTFVSSDQRDLRAGDKWFTEIDAALTSSKVLLVVCSPFSLTRPWVHFESGCAWIRRIPIIPICHSGLKSSQLQPPLSGFQGLTIEEDGFSKKLVSGVAHHFQITKLPRIDFLEMDSELRTATSRIGKNSPPPETPASCSKLSDELVSVLLLLAEHEENPLSAEEIAVEFVLHPTKTKHLLSQLVERKLIYPHYFVDSPATYSIDAKGRAYLVENNLL